MTKTSSEYVAAHRRREHDLSLAIRGEDVPFGVDNLPAAADPARKERCRLSLVAFALEYFPESYYLPMSPGQRADMETMQRVATEGGAYAFAAPRADGKTTRCETATLWAMLYGHRRCVPVVGSDAAAAREIFESIKHELRTNELLRADFPVPCWAAVLSEDVALKAKGWTWGGVKLGMEWGKNKIVLPQLEGADGSGGVVVCRGITGRLRGMRIKIGKRPVRPDMFVIDDPQTDESAASTQQCITREKIILGAIMGSKGAKTTIAAMMPCTILRAGDLAARFLDHKVHPDWHGRTRSLVTAWPKEHGGLWKEYRRMRREESQEAANEFYRANRAAMDEGAVMDWPERYDANEDSAVQSAENLLCDRGEEVFQAEYQNAPIEPGRTDRPYVLTVEDVQARATERKVLVVPARHKTLVLGADVNEYGIHAAAVAFDNEMSGAVVWYGVHAGPDGAAITESGAPEIERKKAVYEALVAFGASVARLPFVAEVGSDPAPVAGTLMIDGGYFGDVVRRYVEGPGRTLGMQVMSAKGFHGSCNAKARYQPTARFLIGRPREQCHMSEGPVLGRFVAFNACYWREVWQKAWLAAPGNIGGLDLFAGRHREFAAQLTREQLAQKINTPLGPIWDWRSEPGRHDFGDAVSLCYVGAAWGGIGTGGRVETKRAPSAARVLIARPSGMGMHRIGGLGR